MENEEGQLRGHILGGTPVGCDLTMFSITPNWLEGWYEDDAITTNCYSVLTRSQERVKGVSLGLYFQRQLVLFVICKKVVRGGTSLVLGVFSLDSWVKGQPPHSSCGYLIIIFYIM